jgi:hypothetical protein
MFIVYKLKFTISTKSLINLKVAPECQLNRDIDLR